ncbi:hypothetical protein M409DRAFT_51968 [Zasmidium cellare ATCC 36951]|uniref:Zn(2)-C6 fungal-type domain-containing protein n=1 Tax=Zasmidium cellare ATCC 36951 TaxID=1080233 RepID=A0A6A6CXY0_ZASCE|nr:uncharacterized protein M409DRAFT_51968 [Zasmidium cellare ATCC 36951]KAF2170226.1 hypothetical protein M409DRAFT_51968 [Zasmidium cellare ATCC 36951]
MSAVVKRTKSGCITCRIRRVKCDETKPECNRCTKTGRKCDGYSELPFSRRDLHAASLSRSSNSPSPGSSNEIGPLYTLVNDRAFNDTLEKRYFQFFRSKTVASTNSLIAANFWDRTVLQACHLEPAVKHAVLALSAWHQYSDHASELQHRDFADRQYQMALEKARDLVSSANPADIDKVLTACVVFICFESVRGNFKDSQLHMDNGRAIARQHANRLKQGHRRQDLIEIQQTLFRLDLPAVCFSDKSSPYHYTMEDFLATQPTLIPWEFQTIFEARDSLVDLSRWMLILGQEADVAFDAADIAAMANIHAEKEKCAQRLRLWYDFFERVAAKSDQSMQLLILNLRQWYHGCQAIGKAELMGPETRWDKVQDHFEVIINVSEEIVRRLAAIGDSGASFSYDIGYIIVVFLTATRCRDPFLRRRGIQILRALPRQEGLWAT